MPATPTSTTLTSDRIFLLTYLCWMFAGCILIFPAILTVMAGSELFSVRYRESWEVFVDGALLPFALQLGILLVVGLVAYIAFRVGLRNREVVLGLDGFVSIRWGKWLPVTLRRIPVAAFTSFVVKKEARFAVTPRSNGQYRMQGMPDRWRLTAQANGRLVNLGSYTTEADAQKAVLFLSS